MRRENLKNPRWWAVLAPGFLVCGVGVLAEWIAKGAERVIRWSSDALDWMYDWAYRGEW